MRAYSYSPVYRDTDCTRQQFLAYDPWHDDVLIYKTLTDPHYEVLYNVVRHLMVVFVEESIACTVTNFICEC